MESCGDYGQFQEEVRVKNEPEHPPSLVDYYLATPIKEETDAWHSECLDVKQEALCVDSVQQEPSCSAAAAALAGLYTDHTVKDELVLGPEVLHRPNVTPVCCGTMPADRDSGQQPHLALKDCTVRLERIPYNTLLARTERTSKMEEIDCLYNTDSEIPYSVDIKTLSDSESIEEGMHTGFDSEIPCYVCSKRFTHKSDLMKHIAIHIYIPSSELDGNVIHSGTEVDNEVHACDICGKIFDLKLELMEHVVSHIYVQEDCEVNGAVEVQNAGVEPGRMWRCSVRLERLLLDAERRTCRVGRRTYRLRPASEPRRATPATDIYRCDYCDKAFRHKSVLRKHIHTHLSARRAHSRLSTREDSNLDRHLKLETRAKPFKCVYCDYKFSVKRFLRNHEMTHTGEYSFQCDYCDYKCIQKVNLKRHVMKHTGVKPFQCNYCDYKCIWKTSLKTHVMKHTGIKPFQCKYCEYKCRRKPDLRYHEMTHIGEYPFQCEYCDYKCIQKVNLKRHVMKHTGVKPFQCNYCDYKGRRKIHLRNHEMTHTGEYPLQCDYCDYKCIQKVNLKRHVMKHTGVKPFQCNYCDYKCRLKNQLRNHEMTHTGVKPFQCNYCDYEFRQKAHLRNHEMTHTGVKPFQCNYCDYKCRLKKNLRNHEMTHTGVKRFQCNYCDYKCRQKNNLRNHEMTHTGVNLSNVTTVITNAG